MNESHPRAAEKSKNLLDRVTSWLNSEGYPTEFRTAHLFQKHGFHVIQGSYVRGDAPGSKREIDVLASITAPISDGFLRISYIVECKWSADKPWIVFTSPTTRMAPSACIAQTISSKLGDAIVWAIAGNETLHTLQTFETPEKGGFGGRQAFSKGSDAFYSAVQAAVSNSKSYVTEYDRGRRAKAAIPRAGVIAFPVVVVDGIIFVAYFYIKSGEIKIEATDHVRCHWKGSPAWKFLATVDFVSMQYLDVFARKRAEETKKLIPIMINCYDEIRNFAASGSPEALTVTPGPRGIVGAPSLLPELFAAQKDVASRRVGDKSGTTEIDGSS